MTVFLKDMFLGQADGERESENDKFLDMFYTGNNKYQELMENQYKYIITGSKGSGKTILSKYVEKRCQSQEYLSKTLKMDSITLRKLIDIGECDIDSHENRIFYEWLIIVEISNLIIENELTFKEFEENIWRRIFNYKKLREYKSYKNAIIDLKNRFEELYGKGNYEFTNLKTSSILKSEIKGGSNNVYGLIKGEDGHEYNGHKKAYYKLIQDIEKIVFKCMKYYKVIIFMDDIDEIKTKLEEDIKYKKTIEQLILATNDLNEKFRNNKLNDSKCVLLLRSDILESINRNSNNLNKIIRDCSIELYWLDKDTKHPENHMLVDMILNKVRSSCQEYSNLTNLELYKILFPEPVSKKSALEFFLDRSFGRPRDIITYLTIIQSRFRGYDHFGPSSIIQCEAEYSRSFLNELYNEMALHIELEYVDDMLKLLKEFGRNSFRMDQIEEFYNNNKQNYTHIKDLKSCLSDLYVFGVLGNSKGRDKNLTYSWAYRRDGSSTVDYKLRFSVHYGLRYALGLKK